MGFSNLEFLYIFLPLFCAAYYLMPQRGRNHLLLFGSVGFYVLCCLDSPAAIVLLAVSTVLNWLLGMQIEQSGQTRRLWLWLGIVWNIASLFFFKYAHAVAPDFFDSLGNIGFSTVALPIGISFYSFRAVGYLADVTHARCYSEKRFDRFALWMWMFPTVLQGPITRYPAMQEELVSREHSLPKYMSGLRTFVLGLGYKALIADRLFRMWGKVLDMGWDSVSSGLAWLAAVAYALFIYFDFAGYSLMAIGVGRMLGFELPENFRAPYISKSMTEFWRRWHITLGNWFRDCIYIPLGGNRHGTLRTVLNLFAVWLFTGIWHGSTWTFVAWGMFLFAVILLEKFFLKKYLDKSRVLCHIYMAFLIVISWAIFASGDLTGLCDMFRRLFPFLPQKELWYMSGDAWNMLQGYWPYLLAGLLCCFGLPEFLHRKSEGSLFWDLVLIVIFCASVYFIYTVGADPFAYGNF